MIYLSEPNLTGNEKKYLCECIDTTFVSSVGEFVTRFENGTAMAAGAEYGVAVSSGTAGLHIALKAFNVGANDLVCIPSFTFIATANAVKHCGAEPWLMDIDPESWTMSAEVLERELRENTYEMNGVLYHAHLNRRVAAIMPVYTLGTPADMDSINQIARSYHLPVIADAAAAVGAKYKGRGLAELADATVFSFNGNKTLTCGGGGVVVSNRKDVAGRIRHLSTTARVGAEYNHDMVGYNYRMTNLQAAVGAAQLERLDEFIEKKRYIHRYYNERLGDLSAVKLFPEAAWAQSSYWFSGVLLNREFEIREVCGKMRQVGIESKTFWKPVHLQQAYLNCCKSDMAVSENIWERILILPSSTGIGDGELKFVVESLKSLLMVNS